jgi:hypothetical protein
MGVTRMAVMEVNANVTKKPKAFHKQRRERDPSPPPCEQAEMSDDDDNDDGHYAPAIPAPLAHYERGDAKVVFGKHGTYSLWDASVKLGVPISNLLDINNGSDVVQPGQEMRVPRELMLRGSKGLGSIGGGTRGGTHDSASSSGSREGGVGPVWRGEKKVMSRRGGSQWNPFNREAEYQLPFPLVGAAAAAAREYWSTSKGSEPFPGCGPPDCPDLFPLEPELDLLPDAKPHFREFLAALRWVETGNQMPAPDGDDGDSIGGGLYKLRIQSTHILQAPGFITP